MQFISYKRYRRWILRIWTLFFAGLLLSVGYVWAVSADLFGLFGQMPSFRVLENPRNDLAAEVYSSDGVLLGKYFRENRSPVEFNQISPHLIHALLATEDVRFERHSGIDLKGTFAIPGYLLIGEKRGSSTITQQLAKNLFQIRDDANEGPVSGIVIDKTKEWLTAIQLERNFTKREIITMYLNTVEFGGNAFGIKSAARTFFKKQPFQLSVTQSALLVGMLNNPALFSPVRYPERALRKRNFVLQRMVESGYISRDELPELTSLPLGLQYEPENQNRGLATYFRGYLEEELHNWARRNNYDLYTDGLRIITSIDSRLQRHAEQVVSSQMKRQQAKFDAHWQGGIPWEDPAYITKVAVQSERFRQLKEKFEGNEDSVWAVLKKPVSMRVFSWEGEKDTVLSPLDSIRYYKGFLHTGMMVMDPESGHVKAWVGGINYKHFKYDHVKQGRRQPGSTFKPIVYAAAIDNLGYTPCDRELDSPVTIGNWTARNYDRSYTNAPVTLRTALGRSLNTVPARLTQRLGVSTIVNYARKMGITSPLRTYPAICLGTEAVTLYELLGAYATFANSGIWTRPFYLVRIEDHNGNVLQEFSPKSREVMNAERAYLMLHLLQGAVQEPGGSSLPLLRYKAVQGNQIAAKTGTTQNYADGWFIGITQELAGAVWFGGDDMSIHYQDGNGAGSRTALPIFGEFLEKAYADKRTGLRKRPFTRPRSLSVTLDCQQYLEAVKQVDSTQYVPPVDSTLKNQGFAEEF